ncbi:MAG: hypothetical protein PHP32_07705, partial [Candidatus Izemoplasmatales bacterium]|nr:hypothetical protein [Candidatus Izemoplasmatales bacterium]
DFYANPELSSITGAEIHQIFAILGNSDLITALAPIAIEVGSDIYEQDLGIPIEDLYAIDYQAEFETLGAVAETLFDILSNSGAFSGGGVEVNVTGDDVRTLFGDMSDSSLVVLLASALIIPMLENGDSTISAIVTVPDGLDWSEELVAVGNVLGAIVDSGVTISDLEGGDPAVFLNAVSSVDLTMLMSSELITNALINILSGDAGIEGLDFLTIPDDIVWRDTYDGSGNLIQAGELRNILVALNAITGVLTNFDFNNLDMSFVSELSDDVIDDIFESRVLVATISTMLLSQDLGDLPLVIPNDVFDGDGYLLKSELKALAKSIALVVSGVDQGFDVQIILNLTETDIQTLLSSRIVAATVGKMVYDMGSDILTIPATVVESVAVDASTVDVVDATELQAILMSLKVLDLTNFDNLAFDASILSSLELIPDVGDPTELDDAKIDTLLSSEIIHATVSQMIIDLGSGASTLLTIPEEDVDGNAIVETVSGTDYVAKAELHALLQALYAIGIGDFATMSFEDTSLILTHKDLLLESAMIHATISSMILDLASGAITIPQTDVLGNPILVAYSDVTYISRTELSAFLDALQLLGIGDPTAFTNSLDLSVLSTGENQDLYLSSAIMHATTSQTLIDLGAGVLLIPLLEEDGVTPVQAQVGPVGDQTTYIVKDEIKAMIDAFLIMGFGDLSSFGGSISSTLIFDHIDTVLLSSSLQATISDQLLNVTSGSLIIPDEDELGNPIRIVQSDVTYVAQTEILAIVDALDMLGLTDLTTFDMTPAVLFTVDFNDLLASATMHATVSDYVLQAAVDETAAPGSAALVIPSDLRENFDLAGVVDDGERVQKAELILLLTSLQTLGITDFS